MSRHDTGTKSFSFERVLWEIQRAFYSFKNSPVLALLLMQAAAFIFVQAKGAGKIYLDMIGILLGITLLSWFFTSVIHGYFTASYRRNDASMYFQGRTGFKESTVL